MLADSAILAAIASGDLRFTDAIGDPLTLGDPQIQSVSVDLRLGEVQTWSSRWYEGDGPWHWVLPPGRFSLASTLEVVTLPDYLAATVEGKSTIARLGLWVHAAGLVEPGFSGQITLELVHHGDEPIELVEGMRICQLVLHRPEGVVLRPYGAPGLGSHYQGQRGPTPARGLEDL
jgi:deoxycytidine triphosphate deaminase